MEWQRGVHQAAEGFAGFRGTDVFPPSDGQRDEWVVAIHFEDEKSLQDWLGSAVRAQWVAKLREKAGNFELKVLPGSFGAWFTGLDGHAQAAPAGWKMVLTVVLGLFPTVMLLSIFVGPVIEPAGFSVSMLIGNILSVSILQWGVMPVLNRTLAPWLHADPRRRTALTVGGTVLILALLAVLAILFRQVKG
jgi:antibiotic biosynthesis monooxygenase (ABM) superfamily enzyme